MNQDFNYSSDDGFISVDSLMTPAAPSVDPRVKRFAIVALVLGILSFAMSCCCYYVIAVLAPLAIVFACMSKRRNQGKMPASAVVGVVFSVIALLFFIAFVAIDVYFASIPDAELRQLIRDFIESTLGVSFEEYWLETSAS